MKNNLKTLLALSFAALISVSVSAQKDMFENGFVMKFGLNMPSSDYADYSSTVINGVPLLAGISPNHKMGYGFEIGTHFFLNSINLGYDAIKLGIDVSWLDLNYQALNYDMVGFNEPFEGYMAVIGAKVGPSFSYSPVSNLAFDLAFKVNPLFSIAAAGQQYSYQQPVTDPVTGTVISTQTIESARGFGGAGAGMRFAPSLGVRFNVLLIGIEYQFGSISHAAVAADDAWNSGDQTGTAEVPHGMMRINLGFKF